MDSVRPAGAATCTSCRTTSTPSAAAPARAGSASSPPRAQARRVINQGKLAVVEAIEVSKLFDCGLRQRACRVHRAADRPAARRGLRLGVRDMELVNKFDNALAGVAGDSGTTGVDRQRRQPHRDRQVLADDLVRRPQPRPGPHAVHVPGDRARRCWPATSCASSARPGRARLPAAPHCNVARLSSLGAHLVRRMIAGHDHRPRPPERAAQPAAARHRRGRGLLGIISSHSWSIAGLDPACGRCAACRSGRAASRGYRTSAGGILLGLVEIGVLPTLVPLQFDLDMVVGLLGHMGCLFGG